MGGDDSGKFEDMHNGQPRNPEELGGAEGATPSNAPPQAFPRFRTSRFLHSSSARQILNVSAVSKRLVAVGRGIRVEENVKWVDRLDGQPPHLTVSPMNTARGEFRPRIRLFFPPFSFLQPARLVLSYTAREIPTESAVSKHFVLVGRGMWALGSRRMGR